MNRSFRALALAAAVLSPIPAVAAGAVVDPAAAPAADDDIRGTVGVCVRWGADATKLAEVVVVKPSGDARVDALAAGTLRELPFPKPPGDTGAWRAMSMGIGGAEPPAEPPSCAGLSSVVSDESEPLADKPLPKQIAA
ncbi:hypothetical protein [Phenylobacterium sp. J367]|uniref:hypothetical protein n=1 Tax=Phenylobacterium sp. J367 TaxID=2898435 RepID=UPI00215174A0|nr:hypothetical protein [Phenylobacterium sp. J367]MCR5879213.1 hypothetical protein [Phenylobacterium sp. J367]